MKKVILTAGVLALGVVAMQDAHAQAVDKEKPWTVEGTLRGFYDDNYNTAPSGASNNRSSYGIEVHPSVDVKHTDGPDAFSASYDYKSVYFFSRPGHSPDQDHYIAAAWDHKFNANDSFNIAETFVDAQEPEVLNGANNISTGIERQNGDNYHNNFNAGLIKQVNNLLGFHVGYANNWYHYTGNLISQGNPNAASYATLLDRVEHNITVDSRWTVDELTTAVLGYQFGIVDHTKGGSISSTYNIPSKARDMYTHYVYVGLDHHFTENLIASARGGLQVSDFHEKSLASSDPTLVAPDSVSPYADLSVNYEYMDGGNASLGFTETQNATDASTTFNQVSSSVYASLTQVLKPISSDLVGKITGRFQNSDYNGSLDCTSNGNDKTYSHGLNLTYAFSKFVSTEIGYNYDKLTSVDSYRAYERNRVYIGVTGTY